MGRFFQATGQHRGIFEMTAKQSFFTHITMPRLVRVEGESCYWVLRPFEARVSTLFLILQAQAS